MPHTFTPFGCRRWWQSTDFRHRIIGIPRVRNIADERSRDMEAISTRRAATLHPSPACLNLERLASVDTTSRELELAHILELEHVLGEVQEGGVHP